MTVSKMHAKKRKGAMFFSHKIFWGIIILNFCFVGLGKCVDDEQNFWNILKNNEYSEDDKKTEIETILKTKNNEEKKKLLNSKNDDGYTPLDYVIYYLNSKKIVEYFVENGADIEAWGEEGMPPIIRAVYGSNLEIVKYLVGKGANINAVVKKAKNTVADEIGQTPLIFASVRGNIEIVTYLVENGASINAQDADGRTALFYALKKGLVDLVKYLIEYGADKNICFKEKETISDWTNDETIEKVYNDTQKIEKKEEEKEMSETLKKQGNSELWNILKDQNKTTPLGQALMLLKAKLLALACMLKK